MVCVSEIGYRACAMSSVCAKNAVQSNTMDRYLVSDRVPSAEETRSGVCGTREDARVHGAERAKQRTSVDVAAAARKKASVSREAPGQLRCVLSRAVEKAVLDPSALVGSRPVRGCTDDGRVVFLARDLVARVLQEHRQLLAGDGSMSKATARALVSSVVVDTLVDLHRKTVAEAAGRDTIELRFSGSGTARCVNDEVPDRVGCGIVVCRRGLVVLCDVIRRGTARDRQPLVVREAAKRAREC